ncbi:MAG: tyrosine-protein kinase [Kribbellaceae bacterium]|nr:tyrosine-protein kinase [Kribbellaceae bacterium]
MSRSTHRIAKSRGIVRSYLWVIILVTVLTAGAAGATVMARPKMYVGAAQVVVYPDAARGGGTVAPDMGTEREVANSGLVSAAAAKAMGIGVTEATKALSVSVPVDAQVLQFKYSSANRSRALAGAAAFTDAYVDYRNKGRSAKLAEVISPATVPTEPEAANMPLIIGLGLVLGLMLGIGFAFVWDRVRGRLRGAADVTRQTGLDVLAQVPIVKQQFPLAPQVGPSTPAREVFGYLAAHLTTLTTRGKGASLLITSPSQGAGKTTVAAQLAIAMAATGKEVVLIGGDLRHPDLHLLFGLPLTPGLTDVLADSSKLERSVQSTEFVNLRVLPGGTPRVGAWFNVEDLELLLQALSKHSFVIVDAPTAIGATESAVLAGRTDFTLLVVDGQRGSRATAAEAVSALTGVGGNLIGCVTNTPRSRRFKRKTVPASFEPHHGPGNARGAGEPVGGGTVAKSEHVGH